MDYTLLKAETRVLMPCPFIRVTIERPNEQRVTRAGLGKLLDTPLT
jgi:hypothetical protein